MSLHFFNILRTVDNNNINAPRVEIFSSSITVCCITSFCFFTLFINLWVCYRIYRKPSLRTSCTGLMVANVALVDILVSLKDFPFLLSVSLSSKWYFEPEWCRSYGLTNVVYIIVSVSTLVSVATDQYITERERQEVTNKCFKGQDSVSRPNNKIVLLGYVIAQTTLSYSLSLLWSKYTFLSRKAFCQVDFSPSTFPVSTIISFLFLIPIAILALSMVNTVSKNEKAENCKSGLFAKEESSCDNDDIDNEENKMHSHLQAAIGIFLTSWCPYIIDSFFPSIESPSIPGVVSAFIPILATSLMPLYFVFTRKRSAVINTTYRSTRV